MEKMYSTHSVQFVQSCWLFTFIHSRHKIMTLQAMFLLYIGNGSIWGDWTVISLLRSRTLFENCFDRWKHVHILEESFPYDPIGVQFWRCNVGLSNSSFDVGKCWLSFPLSAQHLTEILNSNKVWHGFLTAKFRFKKVLRKMADFLRFQ